MGQPLSSTHQSPSQIRTAPFSRANLRLGSNESADRDRAGSPECGTSPDTTRHSRLRCGKSVSASQLTAPSFHRSAPDDQESRFRNPKSRSQDRESPFPNRKLPFRNREMRFRGEEPRSRNHEPPIRNWIRVQGNRIRVWATENPLFTIEGRLRQTEKAFSGTSNRVLR